MVKNKDSLFIVLIAVVKIHKFYGIVTVVRKSKKNITILRRSKWEPLCEKHHPLKGYKCE
jgi:hypothetical protein